MILTTSRMLEDRDLATLRYVQADDFTTAIGLTTPTAERYIRAWTGTRLEKVIRGKYRKER